MFQPARGNPAILSQEVGASFSSPVGVAGIATISAAVPMPEVSVGQLRLRRELVDEVSTLILTRRDIETLGGPFHPGKIVARIIYGVGTASDEIVIDWNYGTSVTVPAGVGKVTVIAQQRGPYPDPTVLSQMVDRFTISAMLVAGSRQSIGAPTLTYVVDIAAGGTTNVRIPNRSKYVMVNSLVGILSDVHVTLTGGGTGTRYVIATDEILRSTGVVIPGPMRFLQLSSLLGEAGLTACFLLDG
jgi:hypothetical protein